MATTAKTRVIPAGLSREQLHEIYYYLRLTRSLEERLRNLYRQGKVIGGLYSSLGQEGESVASAYALAEGDILSPLIRNLGAMLVKGAKPVEVLRQYMAKATSPTAGREMNIHFNDLRLGFLGQISHLGDMVPVMAGIALSFRLRREPRVGLVYVGDGATSTGAFHEGVNFAAVQRVPLVVIVEHNGYAYSTPTSRQTAVERLADKARAYGIPGRTVDGNDVLAVYEATKHAVERARAGEGVTLLELVTYRRRGHAEHDDQRYQPREEIAAWEGRDPIERYTRQLRDNAWIDDAGIAAIDDRVSEELDRAVADSENDPVAAPDTVLRSVYLDPPAADVLWFRRRDA
ncbi:MAG: thiamine pyrophosphate-dependent dehydrogenase E1 component subunit alpha [Gemmatimonadetes bacterium]|nr:thiamine pyrophosphate-dependent dehydrogenase E1 component subunit alpha [Gemmatimonadota bacterium]